MLGVVTLGLLAAATLLAAAPIYARTMADLGLTFVIRDQLRAQPSTRVEFRNMPLQTEVGRTLRGAIEQRIDERIGWFEASQALFLRTGRFAIPPADEPVPPRAPLGQLQSLTGYASHVRVVSGELPRASAPGEPVEVALSPRSARASGLKVGQEFSLNEDFDTCERVLPRDDAPPPPPVPCTPVAHVAFRMPARLVAIIEPVENDESFWVTSVGSYFDPFRLIPDAGPVLPMFTHETALADVLGTLLPAYRSDTAWTIFANPERLTRTNFERARTDLQSLNSELSPLGGIAYSPLTTTLQGFSRSARYQQIPLTVLLLEIAGIALFYVGLVSTISIERQSHEITLLRSRGATAPQVVGIYLVEGAAIGIPVVLFAPLIAAATTALLGLTPPFEPVSGGSLLPVSIPPLAFGMAAAGVGLSLAAILVPAALIARRSAVTQRRAEARPGVGLLHRYYLDFALVAVAGLLLWELHQRGSVFTPSPTGGVSSDPLLLASPALIIGASAALLLRFYPLVLRLVMRTLSASAGLTVSAGLWQLSRSPGQYTRLALLVMMAVAVGTFAASYSSTADRSYRDRANFQSGADLRAFSSDRGRLGAYGPDADTRLNGLAGVTAASAVIRTTGAMATPGSAGGSFQVLGLDPATAGDLLWFRSDFADRPLGALLEQIAGPADMAGKALPGDPATISVWVNSPKPRENVTVWARLRDSEQEYGLLELGMLEDSGWRELTARINGPTMKHLEPPLTLIALILTEPDNRANATTAPIFFDDVGVTDSAGHPTVIEDFESAPTPWAALPTRSANQDKFAPTIDRAHSGTTSAMLTPATGARTGPAGLYLRGANVPLPVLASASFTAATGLRPGSSASVLVGSVVVPIVVRDTFRLFPTLSAANGPALVFNRDQLTSWLNLPAVGTVPGLNEAWFALPPGADRQALKRTLATEEFGLADTLDRDMALAAIERNPLIAAGGSGILFVAFGTTLFLVTAALLVSLWAAAQRRRVEFAVLRMLGTSRGQVFRLLTIEYSLVAFPGIAVGSYLGLRISRQMLSFLDATESGARIEPSFVLETNWPVVLGGAAAVLAAFAAGLVIATSYLAHSSDAEALRTD